MVWEGAMPPTRIAGVVWEGAMPPTRIAGMVWEGAMPPTCLTSGSRRAQSQLPHGE